MRSDAKVSRRALARVDGVRGRRDGKAVEHRARNRSRRRFMGALAAAVLLVGVLFVAAFPTSTYLTQRAAISDAEAELAEVREERERMEREADRLTTRPEIEKRARQELGYKMPGEETYNILPAPAEPIGLPDTWPFTGVERALGAR
ncbi:hypothetical protein BH23ACT2_BH23ACT2_01120 [soil metagenome]